MPEKKENAAVPADTAKTNPKKKFSRFWRIYLICVVVIAALGVVLIAVLWNALAGYERGENEREAEESRLAYESEQAWLNSDEYRELLRAEREKYNPENQTQTLIDTISAEGYAELIGEAVFSRSSYENDRELADYLFAAYPPDSLTVAVLAGENAALQRTQILSGETVLFSLTYIPDETNEQEFIKWKRSELLFNRAGDRTVTVTVPADATVTVNGVLLDAAQQTATEEVSPFSGLVAPENVPMLATYTLEGLAFVPAVTVTRDGVVLNGTIDESDHLHFAYPETDAAELTQELRDTVAELARLYDFFIAGDCRFDEIEGFLLPGTEIYRSLSQLDNRWYFDHDAMELADLSISDVVRYNDSCMTCSVSYTELLYRYGTVSKRSEVTECFDLILVDGVWHIAALTLS